MASTRTMRSRSTVMTVLVMAIAACTGNGSDTTSAITPTTVTTRGPGLEPAEPATLPTPPTTLPTMEAVGPQPLVTDDLASVDRVISPGESLTEALLETPAGSVFLLEEGVHRGQSVEPRDGDVFVGEPGAVMSGASLLTDPDRDGELWVYVDRTEEGRRAGDCELTESGSETDLCQFPEELFVDGIRLERAESLSDLGPGEWFFDYENDRVWIADDPGDKSVELSSTETAFSGTAQNVEIRNLVIEKYANPAQVGAIEARDGETLSSGWLIENNLIQLNHGLGIRTGDSMTIRWNDIRSNGQLGLGGAGEGVLVEQNEIAFNNTAGFNFRWEGGGVKFLFTEDLVVRSNYVHDNIGPGLWTDTDAIRTTYEGNYVVDNAGSGIFHEISFDAVIRDNVVVGNGFGFSQWLYGAGIIVAGSQNVLITENQVFGNANGVTAIEQDRGAGDLGPWILDNIRVTDNIIGMETGLTGVATDMDSTAVFEERDIIFEDNTYVLATEDSFSWMDSIRSIEEWISFGQDTRSQFIGSQ